MICTIENKHGNKITIEKKNGLIVVIINTKVIAQFKSRREGKAKVKEMLNALQDDMLTKRIDKRQFCERFENISVIEANL